MSTGTGSVRFEAVIVPHRSLGPTGLRWVLGSLLALSAVISAGLWYAGAWPAIGFSGCEVLLAVWLVRRHVAGARATELLLLTDEGLLIVRTDRKGHRTEQRLDPAWLRAGLEDRPGRAPALVLQSRGRRMEVGAALGEDEKRGLATALRQALERHRSPMFDNPQLRDD